MYRGDETVSVAPNRFNKVWVGRIVLQSGAQPADGHVEAQVSLDEDAGPNSPDDLASRYQLFRVPKKEREYLERLLLKGNSCAVAEKFSCGDVRLQTFQTGEYPSLPDHP